MDTITPNWEIIPYNNTLSTLWNNFVANSRNATFLHHRNYMDYHSHIFNDASLIAYLNGKPKALLPANIDAASTLHSHQGLTYGGWLLPHSDINGAEMLNLWKTALKYLSLKGVKSLIYKPVPYIYHTRPSQEDIYALWRLNASIQSVLLSSTAEIANGITFDSMRRRHLRSALKNNLKILEIKDDIKAFWSMLSECLLSRHNATPVHSLEEITYLRNAFPSNIRFFGAYLNSELTAGICIYHTGIVAHCQYIATSQTGRSTHTLAPLIAHLFTPGLFPNCRYIDFGTSNENDGHILNTGLISNKFGFGGSGVAYSRYLISTNAWERI